jgi:hypothetical protein
MIQIAISFLAQHGLRVSRGKIKIMGPRDAKLLTGARLGKFQIRASRESLARVRSGIYKLRIGGVSPTEQVRYVDGLVGQLSYIEQLCAKDSQRYACELARCTTKMDLSPVAVKYLAARSR